MAAQDIRAAERVHARAARGSLAQVTNFDLKKLIVSVPLQKVPPSVGAHCCLASIKLRCSS